jgi:hypothetical protein
MTDDHLHKSFIQSHTPSLTQLNQMSTLRDETYALALVIQNICPESPEKTIAIRRLQEALMFANASIAINS